MVKPLLKCLVSVCVVAGSLGAQAAPVFSDNFDASVSGLNVVPTGWTVSDGTVDVVGGGFCVSGLCVDLDGSTGNAGILSRDFALVGGVDYTLNFDLSGSKRGSGTDDILISFGTATLFLDDLAAAAPYTTYSLDFLPGSDGIFSISFANAGGDNIGALLDNLVLTSGDPPNGTIPEPGVLALLGIGLAGLALIRRRKQ